MSAGWFSAPVVEPRATLPRPSNMSDEDDDARGDEDKVLLDWIARDGFDDLARIVEKQMTSRGCCWSSEQRACADGPVRRWGRRLVNRRAT